MAGDVVEVLEGIWEVVRAMGGVGLESSCVVEAACVLGGYWEVVGAVGAGVVELAVGEVVELTVGEGRLQGGAKARWLQLLMEGSYLVPAGHRYLWPIPGPVHLRKDLHDAGSGWKPAEGHGTAAEDEGELGGTSKANTVVIANAQWKRGGGGRSIPQFCSVDRFLPDGDPIQLHIVSCTNCPARW